MADIADSNAGDEGLAMKRVTYTLSELELRMLDQLIRWRHATDPKAASQTIRECIRETYRREARDRGEQEAL